MSSELSSQSIAQVFALCFIGLLLLDVCTRVYLAWRNTRHIAAHRAAVPQAFTSQIPLQAHQKAADYSAAKLQYSLVELLLGAATLIGWTLLGGLNWLSFWVNQLIGPGLHAQVALVIAFVLIGSAIGLPLSYAQTFKLEARFGFNRSSLSQWVMDGIKGLGIGLALGLPLLYAIVALMELAGSAWWVWAWALLSAWTIALMVIVPIFIMPLFNKFEPLKDEALKLRIEQLLERTGFVAKGLYVMDGSKRSAHSNAYFTGLGKSKQIVFFDTLLEQLNHDEIEAVLAHELGHFSHKHLTKRLIRSLLVNFLGLATLGFLSTQSWFYTGLGVTPNQSGANSALALILFMLVAPVFLFFVEPISSFFSRQDEYQADAYAAHESQAAALYSALVKMVEHNASTLTPDPWYVRWYYSHPPAYERLQALKAAT